LNLYLDTLVRYIDFDEADRARLRALHPVLAPSFPGIAARFYEAVWADPISAATLTGPEQVERLRLALVDWMSSGLLGPHDAQFHDRRSRIGRKHVAIGLPHHYIFTAMNVIRTAYLDRIAELYPPAEALALMRSIGKLLDIELAIMVHHYQLDSEEKLVARERHILADRLAAIQTLSAGFAHELRNPLNGAQLQLELLERRLRREGHDSRFIESAEQAQREIERLSALLDDFLAFARPSKLCAQEHDVAEILRRVVAVEAPTAERHGARLHLVETEALIAEVDEPKLHQIVLNLVRNAIEAVPADGRVTLSLLPGDPRFVIRVEDDGRGIPDHVLPRIYEPFFSTKESGTGLGMSIVHSLVALHGGTIELETSSKGTRFDVAIPVRQPADGLGETPDL
jgi:signal transduction histidine kinase